MESPRRHAASQRRVALAALLSRSDFDALLVTSGPNIRYLSGFTGSNGALLIDRAGDGVLATDGRYLIQAAEEAQDVECLEARAVAPALIEHAVGRGLREIGFESHVVTVEQLGGLERAASEVRLTPAGRLVEGLRVIKDAEEQAALRAACQITDAAFTETLEVLRPGITERDVAWALTESMRRHGAEGPAFDIIAAFGENSAIPHHQPTERPLRAGDLVKLDFGAKVDGYHADMTRTVVSGTAADWQREIHSEVAALQERLRAAATPGTPPADLDAAMRADLEAHGRTVAHGLGHGVGLVIHEDPFLTQASAAPPIEAGVVLTVEPGVYLPGRGGVRVEDTVLVTADGPVELTTSPRELLEI